MSDFRLGAPAPVTWACVRAKNPRHGFAAASGGNNISFFTELSWNAWMAVGCRRAVEKGGVPCLHHAARPPCLHENSTMGFAASGEQLSYKIVQIRNCVLALSRPVCVLRGCYRPMRRVLLIMDNRGVCFTACPAVIFLLVLIVFSTL